MPFLAGAAVNNERAPLNEQARPMERATESHPSLEKANELIGAKVINDKNEQLGTIEDIVLTPDRKAVSYAVLSHGGLWGWGGKLFAVPWSAFEIRPKDNVLVLSNVTAADLENAKGFDKDNWPATAHENWLGRDVPRCSTLRAVPSPRPGKYPGMRIPANTGQHPEGERYGAPERIDLVPPASLSPRPSRPTSRIAGSANWSA